MNKAGYLKLSNSVASILLIVFFLISCLSDGFADSSVKPETKDFIGIIPLNITADDKNERLIRNSIGKFIEQRLNNGGLTAERALIDLVKTPEILNMVYGTMQSGIPHEQLTDLKKANYICGGNVVVLGNSIVADFFLFNMASC